MDFFLNAGYLFKKSGKTDGWTKRWFVLNEKTGKVSTTLFGCKRLSCLLPTLHGYVLIT